MREVIKILVLASCAMLAACNTVRGLGEDLQSVADTVDRET